MYMYVYTCTCMRNWCKHMRILIHVHICTVMYYVHVDMCIYMSMSACEHERVLGYQYAQQYVRV